MNSPDRGRMQAAIVPVDPADPERAFARCRETISRGGVIAYPTDTFYGLGADPGNPAAVSRLFGVKGRREDQPILLLIAERDDVHAWAVDVTPQAELIMDRHWPGPLTLVFRAKASVLPALTAGTGTIGLRIPGSDMTRALLRFLGHALTGTSANRSGSPGIRTAGETAAEIGALVDLILDGGETAGGMPSTVVDVTAGKPRVVREGAIPSRIIMGG